MKQPMSTFPWEHHLNTNRDPNWQANPFSEILLNIMSNFVPNETKTIKPRDPIWISKAIKSMLKKQNRIYKNYKKHGYNTIDKVRLDEYSDTCNKDIAKVTL